MNDLTAQDWKKLDELYERRTRDTIAWCVGVSEHDDRQEDIAERYGLGRSYVAQLAVVGCRSDVFVVNDNKLIPNLPNGVNELYHLVSDNKDGERLTKAAIRELCKHGRPTRAMIKAYKQEVGLLPPAPVKRLTSSGNDLFRIVADLVPRTYLEGMSEFGVHALEKSEKKLNKLIDGLTQTQTKEVLTDFVVILNDLKPKIDGEVRRLVKEQVKEKEQALAEREKALFAREKRMTQGIPEKDRKLIQGVLHPDKAPQGQERKYARAFDAFRKLA